MRSLSVGLCTAGLAAALASAVWARGGFAADQGGESLLQDSGLRPIGAHYVLPDESKLNAMFREVRKLQKNLTDANRQWEAVEKEGRQKKDLIVQYTQQRRALRQRLAVARSAQENNQIVGAINELGDRITLLLQADEDGQPQQQARAAVSQAREQYAQHVLGMRALYDQVAQRYQQLAADTQLQAAIAESNRRQGTKRQLGPTRTFQLAGPKLKKLEENVLTQAVDLRRGQDNLLYVTAYLNGKHAQEIAVDTGASIVTLPQQVAEKAGIEVMPDDPTITLRVADGSAFQARLVNIASLRVGKFTVQDVQCAVLPEDLQRAPPLLGQSFLRNFVYKIDADSGKLIMTQVGGNRPGP